MQGALAADAPAAGGEQRVVNVFNSDDDLTNFLAGLRAKYASLYPQYPETGNAQDGEEYTNGLSSVIASDAASKRDAVVAPCTNNVLLVETTSQSFEQKMSQLRSSLQSLQHILPPRTSTTANLLDSFMAVSTDRTLVGGPITLDAAAGLLMSRVPVSGGEDTTERRTSTESVNPGHDEAALAAVSMGPCTTQSNQTATHLGPSASGKRSPRAAAADDSQNDTGHADGAGHTGPAVPILSSQPGEPSTADDHSGHGMATGTAPDPADEGAAQIEPSDAAFVELAAGYIRRTLQAPSSEVSASSVNGRPALPVAEPSTQLAYSDGDGDVQFSLGGGILRQGDTQLSRHDCGEAGAEKLLVSRASEELGAQAPPLGQPVAATFRQHPPVALWEAQQEAAGLDLSWQQQQQLCPAAIEPAGGNQHEGSPSSAARRGHLGPSPGRRRAWQLEGLAAAAPGGGSPKQVPSSQGDFLSGCADGAAARDGDVAVTVGGTLGAGVRGQRMQDYAEADGRSAAVDGAWSVVPPPRTSEGTNATEAGSVAMRESSSSAAWESADDSAAAADDGSHGGGCRNSRRTSYAGGLRRPVAESAQAVGFTIGATDRSGFRSLRRSFEGSSKRPLPSPVLSPGGTAKGGLGDWELQQQPLSEGALRSSDVEFGGPRGLWPQQLARRDQCALDALPPQEGGQQAHVWDMRGSHQLQMRNGDIDDLRQSNDAFYTVRSQAQAVAVLDETAGNGATVDEALRQAFGDAVGQQRQRRRWGSPLHNAQLGSEQQLLGPPGVYTSTSTSAVVTGPGRDSCAHWPQNRGVDRPTPSDSPKVSSGGSSGSHIQPASISPGRLHSPASEAVGLLDAVAPSSVSSEGPPDPQPVTHAMGLVAEDAAAFGGAGHAAAARAAGAEDELGGNGSPERQQQQRRRPQQQQQRQRGISQQRPLRLLPPPLVPVLSPHSETSTSGQDAAMAVPAPQPEQPLRQQTSMDAWLQPSTQFVHAAAWSANDEVLCGSPAEPLQPTAWDAAADGQIVADAGGDMPASGPEARSAGSQADLLSKVEADTGNSGGSPRRGADGSGITANSGGIAFSISARQALADSDLAVPLPRSWGTRGPLPPTAAAAGHHGAPATQSQFAAAPLAAMPSAAALGPISVPDPADWERLNRQLREAGFSGLVMAPMGGLEAHAASGPEPASLHRCLSSVLEQYVRRNRLVAELLAATEQSGRIAEQQEATVRELKREANAARAAAEKARRELADISSQQLPKVEARHSAQLGRLRSETTKLKEALRVSELDLTAKAEEIRALKATVAGLQSVSSHNADVEGAALRQRVAQLEGLLRNRDKEVEKLKATKEAVVGQAEDGQANALDRAYEAEATARRLDTELAASRARVGQLEQGLRQRERDVAAMREDLQQIKACEAAATLVAQERSTSAEEAARRAEGEAAALRGKIRELEGVLRLARQELDKQRSEAEALRSSAYEEIYRLEDECRTLGTDLAASRTRVTQLEHVARAKDRDIARVKDEKEAAKAAERERARVAEEVSVKLEAELTATKVRLTQAEGAVRTREREQVKLAELLRQTQGAEVEAWLKQAKIEEGSRKMENDFTSLRLRVLQLEATLKGRDKECDKLARTVESMRGEAHELTSRLAKSDDAARKAEADLVVSRGKVLSLEGHIRVKEREQERLVRVVEGLKAGDAELASRQAALEDAARRLDGQLTAARSRVTALEGVVRARDVAVERLNRQLEALKTADFERTAQALKSEEAARQQDVEVAALRQRTVQLETQLRAKERELERSARQIDAARAAEADAGRRLADTAAAAAKLEAEVAAGRARAAQLGEALRGRERELAALSRALEVHRAAEHEANSVAGRTEEAARKLDGEAAELRQRLIHAEGQLRTREREAERQARALEAAQTLAAEASMRQGEAEAAARRLEADAAGLRQRLAQAEGAVRAREKELERAEKVADQARGAEVAAEAKLRTAEANAVQLDGELSSLRLRISQLESAARGQSKEMERLTRVVDKSKVAEVDAAARAQRSDESARQVATELASARSRLASLEASLAAREQETQRLQRVLVAAEAQAATQVSRSDDFVRRVEADLATMRQQAAQLAQLIRSRDRQLATLRAALEATQAAEVKAAEQRRQSEEALKKVETELATERQRAVQLEGQLKSRDREMERMGRQLDAGRDQTTSAAVAAGREVSAVKEAAARADAALSTARARVTQLESELLAKERQLEGLQRLVGSSRAGDAEAAAAAEERARRAEEAARRLDAELAAVRQRYAHLEHNFRSRETTLDKLKAALADKVALEERRVARDKAAYQRIRAAYVATMAPSGGGAAGGTLAGGAVQQQRAAGAMAAAARELRPVEIVGLYESRREAAEQELAAYRAEVRSLADQLREAQNHIAIKDRTGAWRTPTELADMQARIILLERRSADLQRELDRARLEAAEAARMAERRLAEAEHRVTQLKEDNEALVHEMESRPTIQDNRALKREVEILERRLLQVKGSTAANGAGADAEGGETALSIAVTAKARNAGALMTTAQRMARDRALHRLGLRTLEDWPKDVLVDLLQDLCIELDLRDATTLTAAVRKTLRVVGAVPRMEAFIGAVCERVYLQGAPFLPPHIDGTTDPSRVLEVLEVWQGLLQEGAKMREAMRAVVEVLAARTEGMATPIHGPSDVVASVRQLVEAEAVALTARESLVAASHHMAREPEHLLSRLVSHFMRLFECPSLDGFVPVVNRLYVNVNEQRNFAKALAAALDLPADAGPSACMTRVRELADAAVAASGVAELGGGAQYEAAGSDSLSKKPVGAIATAVAHPYSVAVPGVEASAALEKVMLVFGVRTATAAADAAEKVVARLRRLDEVLPRYQRLASQLFEALRCTSLEEVMPALKIALQQRQS